MYKITLDKDDFLRFQLFTASKSKRIKNKRIRGWILTTFSFLCLGFILSENEDKFLSYYFFIIAVISLFFYPLYNRWRYKKHYAKYIEENYKNRMGVECEISINGEYLNTKDHTGEGKIKLIEIEEINEIAEDLFIKVKSGENLIIPRRIDSYDNFIAELKDTTKDSKTEWNDELNWKWK